MGWLAALFCVVVGFFEMSGSAFQYFGHPAAANMAFAYGMLSLFLLFLTGHYRLRGRACLRFKRMALIISIVYAVAMIVIAFSSGNQPGMSEIIRLVFKVGIAWLVYSSICFLAQFNPSGT